MRQPAGPFQVLDLQRGFCKNLGISLVRIADVMREVQGRSEVDGSSDRTSELHALSLSKSWRPTRTVIVLGDEYKSMLSIRQLAAALNLG